jgi:hypothetical protein
MNSTNDIPINCPEPEPLPPCNPTNSHLEWSINLTVVSAICAVYLCIIMAINIWMGYKQKNKEALVPKEKMAEQFAMQPTVTTVPVRDDDDFPNGDDINPRSVRVNPTQGNAIYDLIPKKSPTVDPIVDPIYGNVNKI